MNAEQNDLVALADAAHQIGTDYQQLRFRVIRGDVEGVKVGRFWYIPRMEIDRLREGGAGG